MNFYIATRGALDYLPRVRAIAAELIAAGHKWTFDWTIDLEAHYAAGLKADSDLEPEEVSAIVEADFKGVLDADVIVYVSPLGFVRSEGAAYELGAHHMKRDLLKQFVTMKGFEVLRVMFPVASICVGTPNCIFARRCDYFVEDDSEVLAVMTRIAAEEVAKPMAFTALGADEVPANPALAAVMRRLGVR